MLAFTPLRARLCAASPRDASTAAANAPPENQCVRKPWCVRGYRHNGRGGHCSDNPDATYIAPPSVTMQCERHPLCTRGYRHGGNGGHCSIPRTEEEPGPPEGSLDALAALRLPERFDAQI